MRKTILTFLTAIILAGAFCNSVNAQSRLIHYWHFNSYAVGNINTPSIPPIAADFTDLPGTSPKIYFSEFPGTSGAYATILEGFTSLSSDYDTVNLRMGQPAGNYIRTHDPSDSMELLIYVPSTHFNNLLLTFGTSKPNNGATHQNYDYSVDSGATWITTGLSMLTDSVLPTFQRVSLSSSNTAVNNNPKLVFRIKWSGNTTGTSGNNRFDNFSLDGDTISTSAVINIPGEKQQYSLYPNPVNNNLTITTTTESLKYIIITNALGQKVYESSQEKKQFSIGTSALVTGYYYIKITEAITGQTTTLKFLKN